MYNIVPFVPFDRLKEQLREQCRNLRVSELVEDTTVFKVDFSREYRLEFFGSFLFQDKNEQGI